MWGTPSCAPPGRSSAEGVGDELRPPPTARALLPRVVLLSSVLAFAACSDPAGPGVQPVVTIAADAASVTEGSPVRFTLTATPAPTAPLVVSLSWADTVPMLAGTPPPTATISTDGTGSIEVATDDDEVDEPYGEVTVTVAGGPGYVGG